MVTTEPGFASSPGFGDFVTDTAHQAMISHQRVISPNTTNSLRLGFGRLDRKVLPENHKLNTAGILGVNWLQSLTRKQRARRRLKSFGISSLHLMSPPSAA